jgi:16S rRNA (guanine527-N7)-methyltransferase
MTATPPIPATSVSRETELTERYLQLIEQWGQVINLTSKQDIASPRLWDHVESSLSIVPHLPPGLDALIDLGSGQGFPAIPIAIHTGIAVNLIESDRRKAAFLTTVLAKLKLKGAVWPGRIETAKVGPALCITARALAPIETLLRLAKPHLQPGGCCLFLKSAAADEEILVAQANTSFTVSIIPTANPPSCLVKITDLR